MRGRTWTALVLACAVGGCGGGTTPLDASTDAGGTTDTGAIDSGATDLGGGDLGSDAPACADADGDGHADVACGGDDCDDADPHRYPGNPERCDTLGHDDDCNPSTLGADGDGDGFVWTMCCDTQPDGSLLCGTDCDDTRATVNPSAVESCNGIDDDCNGMVDDHGVQFTFFRDVDGDGYGDPTMTMTACTAPSGYVLTGGDCDDVHPAVHPGVADGPTLNCDTVDNDCNGTIDPGCTCIAGATRPCGMSSMAPCHLGAQACTGGAWGVCAGSVDPVTESCNGIDDDCNGVVDDGLRTTCYADGDADGYAAAGATGTSVCGACGVGTTGTAPGAGTTDCNDAVATTHPGALELCNAVDDNCSSGGGAEPAEDGDGDHHSGPGAACCAVGSPGCATGYPRDDCNDADANVFPGQTAYFTSGYCGPGYQACPCAGYLRCVTSLITCPVFCTGYPFASFDYDCSGTETAQPATPTPACGGRFCATSGCGTSGYTYTGIPPGCGATTGYVTCGCSGGGCAAPVTSMTQFACH